jgi:hypothetical protein
MEPETRQPPIYANESPSGWSRVRKAADAKDREKLKTTLSPLELPTSLAPLFLAVVADEAELAAIEKAGVGKSSQRAEALRTLQLLGGIAPSSMKEAEETARRKLELQDTITIADRAIGAAQRAMNARAGLRCAFAELFGEKVPEHSGHLSSWIPPTKTATAANELGINLYAVGSWRTVSHNDKPDGPRKVFRSFGPSSPSTVR